MIDPIYWFVIRVKYLFFRIFQARLRPIWIMDVVGREGWRRGTKDLDDPNMISATVSSTVRWSNNATDRICRTVETGWSAQNIYSQIVAECNRGERMCLVGHSLCYKTERHTPAAHHSKSMLINNAMKNGEECFDAHRGKKGGGWTIGNAFFSFWQWQVQQSRQSTVSVPWGRGVGKFQWPALFGPALPQGNFCGELFSHSLHFITLGIFTESDHNNIKT